MINVKKTKAVTNQTATHFAQGLYSLVGSTEKIDMLLEMTKQNSHELYLKRT